MKFMFNECLSLEEINFSSFERETGIAPAASCLEGTLSTNWYTPAYFVFVRAERFELPKPSGCKPDALNQLSYTRIC